MIRPYIAADLPQVMEAWQEASSLAHPFLDRTFLDGVGRALLDRARSKRESLELAVFEANAAARAFYRAYGFEDVERRIHPPTGQPEIRMRLEIRRA